MPFGREFKRFFGHDPEPEVSAPLDSQQTRRIRERQQTDPVIAMIGEAKRLGGLIGLNLWIQKPLCFISSGSSTDPACEHNHYSQKVRKCNPARHANLGKLIGQLDKIYGHYLELDDDEMCYKLSSMITRFTQYYLRDTTQPGVVRYTYHADYLNARADEETADAVLKL